LQLQSVGRKPRPALFLRGGEGALNLIDVRIMCSRFAKRWKRQYFEVGNWLKTRTINTEAIYQ
jgi:hypothetical protein